MRFASGILRSPDQRKTARALAATVKRDLGEQSCHLALVFVSTIYQEEWQPILQEVRSVLGHPTLIGCSGGGVIGPDQELELVPAISLVAAHLPEVEVQTFHIDPYDAEPARPGADWHERLGVAPAAQPIFLLLPEPFTCDAQTLLHQLNEHYPGCPVIGGLASGAEAPGQHRLFLNDEVLHEGAVGVALTGNVTVETIVAQGCRPIGQPLVITQADGHLLSQLGGRPALDVLKHVIVRLPARDQQLAQQALFVGIAMNEMRTAFARGDFLIRNVIGIEEEQGALLIGERLQVGQTVQFHLRDAATSKEDLQALLTQHAPQLQTTPPKGGLLFSCLGRGQALYGEPHYDIRAIRQHTGPVAIGGFFCNGEIGPVGRLNFLHGYTSSLALFRPRTSTL